MNAFLFQDPIWLLALIPLVGFTILSVRRERRTGRNCISQILFGSVTFLS